MPPLKRTFPLLMLAAAAAAFFACAPIQKAASKGQFERRSREFVRALRWGEFEKAAAFLAAGSPAPDPASLKEVRIADAEIGDWDVAKDAVHATQEVTFRYYRADTLVERTLKADLIWRYDPESREWFLLSGFPAF